jgi:hypothetical protein
VSEVEYHDEEGKEILKKMDSLMLELKKINKVLSSTTV